MKLAIIGAGNWGQNLVRNFYELLGDDLVYVCDKDNRVLEWVKRTYPGVKTTDDYKKILKNNRIDSVVIATPSSTHYSFAKESLLCGKNVFVEKPVATRSSEAAELVELSEKRSLTLMVGHLMLYHPAVRMVKNLIDAGELGRVFYMYSRRLNLGVIRKNENALWNFAPHDVSVSLFLLNSFPERVWTIGKDYIQEGIEDIAFVVLEFPGNIISHIHVSWLDPHRRRELTVVGSKKMVVFNDVANVEKIRIYDKGVNYPISYQSYGDSLTIRIGDIYSPKVEMKEPLKEECRHFIECVKEGKRPLSDGNEALDVVRILEAAQESLKSHGKAVHIKR
ncbi:MAG: Gfo/Idh/MocA family oxidoreductase [Candidatus Aenigmatarchaeota archaeon]